MPRVARVAPGGIVFHALNRANAGLDLFDSPGDFAAFEAVLAETLDAFPRVRLLAYCLMPNHWHLVLWPRSDGELGRFVQRLTVTHVRRRHERRHTTGRGHLYQGTYKSFPVQHDEHLLVLCRYVERNPLRAGLVRRAQDWRWCSLWLRETLRAANAGAAAGRARARASGKRKRGDAAAAPSAAAPATPRLDAWPVDEPRDWLARVNAPQTAAEEQAMLESIRRGRPFGSAAWQKRTAVRLGLQSAFRPRGRPPKKKPKQKKPQ